VQGVPEDAVRGVELEVNLDHALPH
jgi:hypothetical protein